MKKIIALAAIIASAQVAAFDFPFSNNNNPYVNGVEDNGIFAFNPWEMTDPRWYSTEFANMINEFDTPEYVTAYQHAPAYGQYHTHDFPVAK